MLSSLTRLAIRKRRLVLVATLLFLALAGAVGGGAQKALSANGGFDDPRSASSRATDQLTGPLASGPSQLVLLLDARAGQPGVDDAAVTAAGAAVTQELRRRIDTLSGPRLAASVTSYWSAGRPAGLRSADGRAALVTARLADGNDAAVQALEKIRAQPLVDPTGRLDVRFGGVAAVFGAVSTTIKGDLARAESLAVPVVLILLVLVFGSAVAALLPLLVGVLSVLGTFLVLRLLVEVTDVSVYATNLAISLGLGLGIDYSLFILTRFREERARGLDPHDALVATARTAGRTVLFSAVTVAAALAALLVFPLYFLKSFGYAGIAATAIAAVGALVVLPALIAVLGDKVDRFDLRGPVRRLLRLRPPPPPGTAVEGHGAWHRIATAVMRRPVGLGGAAVVVLLVLGAPFLGARFGLPDDRVLPASAESHRTADALRQRFTAGEASALFVTATAADAAQRTSPAAAGYAAALSAVPGVGRVDAATGTFAGGRQVGPAGPATARFASTPGGTWLSVVPAVEAYSPAGEKLVRAVRGVPAPFGVLVGGDAAQFSDTKSSIASSLPLALGIIALVSAVVLFLFTGSVLLPLKAVVLNLLSVCATFGVAVWAFQEGHLAGTLDFTQTGILDLTTPILVFCVVFGLSMDYEVFLLSRVREAWLATGDNRVSVARGLERTGQLITAAAALLAINFAAFVTSGITFIKLLGFTTALAVVLDATLVRAVLVPAFMRLAGRANWWAPPVLRRLHDRIGLREGDGNAVRAPAGRPLVDA